MSTKHRTRGKEKTHDGDPKPDVSFGQLIADEELLVALELLFDLVQGFEQRIDRSLVCFWGIGEPSFVNTIWTGKKKK